jgi:hypothetical protein
MSPLETLNARKGNAINTQRFAFSGGKLLSLRPTLS